MPFTEVPNKVDFPAQEREVLAVLEGAARLSETDAPCTRASPSGRSSMARSPPTTRWACTTAGAAPTRTSTQRFWAMRGRELRYQNGFDCQGLWVEVEVEKELGFTSKKDIEEYGLARFVRKCKERVLRYAAVQTEQSIRLGYWMDWNDPEHLRWLADKLDGGSRSGDHRRWPAWPGHRHGRADRRPAGPARAGRQLLHLFQREQLYDLDLPQEVLGEGLDLPRRRRDALVPALRHRHQPARDRHRRLSRADPPHASPCAFRCAVGQASRCWSGPPRPGR